MAFTSAGITSTIGDFGNAASDLMSGQALEQSAEGDIQASNMYAEVATEYGKEQNITTGSGALQLGQENRQIEQSLGQNQAAEGKGNVAGGSAGDILRDQMRQGAVAKMTIQGHTAIQEEGEKVAQLGALNQEQQAVNAAEVAQTQAGNAGIMGAIQGGMGLLSFAAMV